MSTQQDRKLFADWYWGDRTGAERSQFYRNGWMTTLTAKNAWHAWQQGASVGKSEADATVARLEAEVTALRKYAFRWNVLLDLPKARSRIWNHVLDEEQKRGHNDIEGVIDAALAARSQEGA